MNVSGIAIAVLDHRYRMLLAIMAAAMLAGCTGADRNDPGYNTKKSLISDSRQ